MRPARGGLVSGLLCVLLSLARAGSGQQQQQLIRARPFRLTDVQLTGSESAQLQAQALNTAYLKFLEVDRLLFNFYRNANISSVAEPYGGWEAPAELVRLGGLSDRKRASPGGRGGELC